MCIIAIKIKGSDFAPMDIIKNCCDNNPDGFAMAWNEGGEVKTFRTMDKGEAIARYYTLSTTLDPAVTGFVFHARIATHGSKKVENCHCWTGSGLAFAHNGILSIPNRDDMTDSETFFRDYFLPVYEACGLDKAVKIAEIAAGHSSKFAFIAGDGTIGLVGQYIKDEFNGHKGKIYFSNSSYRPRCYYPSAPSSAYPSTRQPFQFQPKYKNTDKGKGNAKGGGKEYPTGSIAKAGSLTMYRSGRGLCTNGTDRDGLNDDLFGIV